MSIISDDDDPASVRGLPLHDPVDPLHKRTGRIDARKSFALYQLIDLFGHPVRTDDDAARLEGFERLLAAQHPDAFLLQILHHFLIVYDRTISIDLPRLLRLLIYGLDSPPDAEAESRRLCQYHFHHCAPLPHRSIMASTTCSIVMADESRRTASFACVNGESSLCIS